LGCCLRWLGWLAGDWEKERGRKRERERERAGWLAGGRREREREREKERAGWQGASRALIKTQVLQWICPRTFEILRFFGESANREVKPMQISKLNQLTLPVNTCSLKFHAWALGLSSPPGLLAGRRAGLLAC